MAKTYKQGLEDGKSLLSKNELHARLADLTSFINVYDVFGFKIAQGKKIPLIANKEIDPSVLNEIKGDILIFRKSRLWSLFNETVRFAAINKAMVDPGDTLEQKGMTALASQKTLYSLSLMADIMKCIEEY